MIFVSSPFPPGNVCIPTNTLGRYSSFNASLHELLVPVGTQWHWFSGPNTRQNLNDAWHQAWLSGGWVWTIPDDHKFPPDLLLRLLARQVDVVLPLCVGRWDQKPSIKHLDNQPYEWHELPEGGLLEVGTGGDAGLLMTQEVLEKTGPPWNEFGTVDMDYQFGQKIRKAGFKFLVDLDNPIGHITPVTLWPERINGTWQQSLRVGKSPVTYIPTTNDTPR